ncbi:MAG TPA: phosphohistidine phosphatase SixA [Bryobacteraceae bacterium]|jgi:phosphohistidine phosphatase|nr:phosphohistidine phosphatase SixA [Bryobacteraceae bacterium]
MQLYLLRHGIAEEGGVGLNDADRALTAQGRRKLRQVLQAALEAQVKPTLILSSPLKRAIQTAEIVKEELGYKDEILRTKALVPGSTVELVWDEIRDHKDEEALMLVGHNPLFDSLAGYLLGQPGMELDFKKGAILRVDFDNFPAHPKGVLRWYITPKLAASRQ